MIKIRLISLFIFCVSSVGCFAGNYFVDAAKGSDRNDGHSAATAFRTLERASKVKFGAGDVLYLASGQTHRGTLELIRAGGSAKSPFKVTSTGAEKAVIDAKGYPNGILIDNCSNIIIENLSVTADGGGMVRKEDANAPMRCGVFITATSTGNYSNIGVRNVDIHKVYYEEPGFVRDPKEVDTPNGTQKYGWGVRVIVDRPDVSLSGISVEGCDISLVSHTGIRFTGKPGSAASISDVRVIGNKVNTIGGPGIQFASVKGGYVSGNDIDHSGDNSDSRHWGRGSCLWTWGSEDFQIERNRFQHANGPADSAGAHIDFGCRNIVIQYCLSANNGGGFCEILGNNYNCSYRYNVSVDDGYRISGQALAFQEGKTIWYSGYVGKRQKRNGPFNSYVYNNTIYLRKDVTAKMAIENTSLGICMVNNIFCIEGEAKTVLGDQYSPEKLGESQLANIVFTNNLFLHQESWPGDNIKDAHPLYGDPGFATPGGVAVSDYIPSNRELVRQGVRVEKLPGDKVGLKIGLDVDKDILGNAIGAVPCIGAIYVR